MSEVKVRCDRDTLLLSVARSRKRAALFFSAFVNQFSLSTFIQFLNFVYKPSADNSPVGDGNRYSLHFSRSGFKRADKHQLTIWQTPNFERIADTRFGNAYSF